MTARDRQRRRRRRSSDPARLVLVGLGALVGLVIVGIAVVAAVISNIAGQVPTLEQLKLNDGGASSIVFAGDGSRLGVIASDTLRTPIRSTDIPKLVKDATVAIEDQRFYKHNGIDFESILRAAVTDVTSGKALQGGSTITMQLARNLYIKGESRSFKRKIQEAVIAQRLEKAHTKDWILADYLNVAPYGTVGGQSAIGVQAAARIFFNEPAGRLTLPQAALLAGLPQAPSYYNPYDNPRAALTRRNEVLTKMAQLGYITNAQATDAIAAPLGVHRGSYYTQHRENFFFDYVKQQLIDRYGANTVLKGGLRIYTTIDLRLQQAARNAISTVLGQAGDPAAAIVSIDPRNGYIRAMAESPRYDNSQFNLASQGHRQPGSTFKTMVLLTALRQGVDPRSTYYESRPLDFVDPVWGPIKVQTYSHSYKGSENIVQATLQSDNTIYEQLDLDVGPRNVRQTAIDAGVTSPLQGLPAEGLGGLRIGVSPLEMANAYATIADGGWRNAPHAVTKVTFPDGHVDNIGAPKRVKAFPDGVTSAATDILQQNIQSGTGTAANYGCPAAGKTGTVDNFTDAWFDGYTPHMSTSVWVGYPKAKIPMTSVHGIAVAGGTFPAQIWHDYMQVAMRGDCSGFPAPTEPINYSSFNGRHQSAAGASSSQNGQGKNQNNKNKNKPNQKHPTPGHRPAATPTPGRVPHGALGTNPSAYVAPVHVTPPPVAGVPGGAAAPR